MVIFLSAYLLQDSQLERLRWQQGEVTKGLAAFLLFAAVVMRICIGRMRVSVFGWRIGFLTSVLIWIFSGVTLFGAQDVSLTWTPNPDTNVAGYALYVGTNSGSYSSRIDVGTNTLTTVSGLTNGVTYYFVTTDYDSADVESTPSNEAQFAAPTNNPPALNTISNYNIAVLSNWVITVTASDSIKKDALTFSLDPGAPTNMDIDPTNGTLAWTPGLSYAGTTNTVIVRVTDSSTPPESAITTFTIVVGDYAQISFGRSVVTLGQTNSVPLILNSSAGVTNVTFVLDVPGNRMTNLSVTTLMPSIATASQSTNGAARSIVTFKAASGKVMQGQITVAQLNYKAVTNLPSCFAPMHATSVTATYPTGAAVPTTFGGLGEAVLIGAQALSQSCIVSNGQQNVIVFGTAGTNYQLQSKIGLTGTWTNEVIPSAVMPTNLFVTFSNVPPAASGKFYRVHVL